MAVEEARETSGTIIGGPGRYTKPARRVGARFHRNLRTCRLLPSAMTPFLFSRALRPASDVFSAHPPRLKFSPCDHFNGALT